MGRAENPIAVEVVASPGPRQTRHARLLLPAGSTVAQAVAASGFEFDAIALTVALWGRKVALTAPLREGDRVELCRGLSVDPKEARRLRYKGHKARGTGRPRPK